MVAHGQAFAILRLSCRYDFSFIVFSSIDDFLSSALRLMVAVPVRSSKQVESLVIRSRRGAPSAWGGLGELQYVSFSSFPSLIFMIRDFYFSLDAVHNIRLVLYLCMSECKIHLKMARSFTGLWESENILTPIHNTRPSFVLFFILTAMDGTYRLMVWFPSETLNASVSIILPSK